MRPVLSLQSIMTPDDTNDDLYRAGPGISSGEAVLAEAKPDGSGWTKCFCSLDNFRIS
jgi:hypothetical protein